MGKSIFEWARIITPRKWSIRLDSIIYEIWDIRQSLPPLKIRLSFSSAMSWVKEKNALLSIGAAPDKKKFHAWYDSSNSYRRQLSEWWRRESLDGCGGFFFTIISMDSWILDIFQFFDISKRISNNIGFFHIQIYRLLIILSLEKQKKTNSTEDYFPNCFELDKIRSKPDASSKS